MKDGNGRSESEDQTITLIIVFIALRGAQQIVQDTVPFICFQGPSIHHLQLHNKGCRKSSSISGFRELHAAELSQDKLSTRGLYT
jgi:Co/Zn/Cd efflux system component